MSLQSPTEESNPPSEQLRQTEEALQQLARLLKSVRYYPPQHPALSAAAEMARQRFTPLFLPAVEALLIVVRKDHFLLENQPFAKKNLLLEKLARQLFSRRVQTLLILPEATLRDFIFFSRCLALDPQTLQAQGGVSAVLEKLKVSRIWINESDLTLIRKHQEEIEEQIKEPSDAENRIEEEFEQLFANDRQGAENEEKTLEMLLQQLRAAGSDNEYRHLLQEIAPLFRIACAEEDRYLTLEVLTQLYSDSTAAGASPLRRGLAAQGLAQHLSDDVLEGLTNFLCTRTLREDIRAQILPLLTLSPEKMVPRLMDRLVREKDLPVRRLLIDLLVRQGPPAAPLLANYLADPRWFVVRNAVTILGEIREPQSASLLQPLLGHKEVRVARETVRSLTKIGGQRAVGVLLSLVEAEDMMLARQSLLSLGAMKNTAAVPVLLKLISRPDLVGKRVELKKDAIRTLGEIGSPEAVPALLDILRRQRLWRRGDFNELRAAAAIALGEIGAISAKVVLEAATEDRSETVARAALQALKQFRKLEEHGSGMR